MRHPHSTTNSKIPKPHFNPQTDHDANPHQTKLWKQYPKLWTICYSSHKICLDGTKAQYFYNKQTRESQWTHPVNEKELIKLQEKKQKLIDIINFFLSISN